MNPRSIAFVLIAAIIVVAGMQIWAAYTALSLEFEKALVLVDGIDRLGRVLSLVAVSLVGAIGYYIIDSRGASIFGVVLFLVLFVVACIPFVRAHDIGNTIIDRAGGGNYALCETIVIEDGFNVKGGEFMVLHDRPEACVALNRAMEKEDWVLQRDFFGTIKYINDWYAQRDADQGA